MSISASFAGRLTADPQQSQVNNNTVVNFNVAVDSTQRQNNEYLTTFVRVGVWGRRGDFVMQHFHKGDPIYLAGELVERHYQNQQGEDRQQLTMVADRAEFVPRPSQNHGQGNNQQMSQGQPNQQINYNNNAFAQQAQQQNNGFNGQQVPQGQQNGQFNQAPLGQPNQGFQPNNGQPQGQNGQIDPNSLPF